MLQSSDYGRHQDEVEPPKKRVRFATDVDGEMAVSEVDSDIVHSDLDKPKLWWSSQERSEILDDCRFEIAEFLEDHVDEVRHYVRVFKQCCEEPTQSSSDALEKATVSLPTKIRGLEWGIAPDVKVCRKAHVQTVLDIQDLSKTLSGSRRDRILSMRAVGSSRPCLIMARLMGEGDARYEQRDSDVDDDDDDDDGDESSTS